MHIRITGFAAVVLIMGSVWPVARPPATESHAQAGPWHSGFHRYGEVCRLIALPGDVFTFVPPPTDDQLFYGPTAATFNVTYTGFGSFPAAQAAFQHAVNIWAGLITSPVTINVSATFESLGAGVLGSAGPNLYRRNFSGGVPNTWYGDALADKINGTDLGGSAFDIEASFNSNFGNWYFGTNGVTPAGQYDFVSVVLHELGHGLGFLGSATVSGSTGSIGILGSPVIYDRFALTETNAALLTAFMNPSTALGTQLRQAFNTLNPRGPGVYFGGTNAVTGNGGLTARLYTPAAWAGGSSYSHLDENTYPPGNANSLMTYALSSAEAIHTPGPVTLGMFVDMGWNAACAPSLNISNATFAHAGGSGTVNVTIGAGCAWTATSNSGFLSITGGSSGTGNGTVSYNVAANAGSIDRVGTLTIAGLAFSVTQTSNIGGISGTVTGATGVGDMGLSNVTVAIYNAAGAAVTSVETNVSGQYIVNGLPAGTYFAHTYNIIGYLDELYNNLPCFDYGCNKTAGTPITVTAGATTNGINFALAVGGSVSGTVTGVAGVDHVEVEIYSGSGRFVATGFVTPTGQYETYVGLPTGTYFALAWGSGYVDQVYNNVPCPGSYCGVTVVGTPFAVTAGATTSGIDFAMAVGGLISGTVTGAGSVGLNSVWVEIFNASGSRVGEGFTNATGQYLSFNGLPTGNYFARTRNSAGYVDELYNNLPCAGGTCDVTTGTPISVTAGTITPGVNFALGPRTVTVAPATLNFTGTNTGGVLAPITPPQKVTVAFDAVGTSTWSATANQPWVQLTGASGTGAGSFTVGIINPGGVLPPNVLSGQATLNATVTLTSTNVTNSPKTIPVTLKLNPVATYAAPIGLVDTPLQNASGVVGAIAVTGWVVDDVGIASVQLYRNCLVFEPAINCQIIQGQNVVFIGNATLVPGARSDIEALFPTYPSANVGAWGYLLLTSMLPHIPNGQMFGGQGPLTLSIFATDLDGHVKQLGRTQFDTTATTITMGNDTIAKPFGAIDTPGQGATISGAGYANFGWALTPDGNAVADASDIVVPTNGSTMSVLIDGAPVGVVSFNQCRGLAVLGPVPGGAFCDDDVSNIFGNPTPLAPFTPRASNPTRHRNLDAGRGPISAYILDTTALANGIHTIMWVVFDDAGRGEGIGSRFFTVLNGSSLTAGEQLSTAATLTVGSADALADAPVDAGVVWAQQGFTTPREAVWPDATGRRAVRMPAQGRLEVALGDGIRTGYLVANGTLRALPPGSRLDPATGVFTWHPVLGYLGTYELTFLRENGTQVPIAVTLEPDGTAAGHIEMAINRPATAATISGVFTVEGWALDTGAWQGAGIGAVHVWAQRVDVPVAAPEFLGAGELNGARPDVATTYGTQFERAGWALSVSGLAPGTYDVTGYVWGSRTQQFEDARTVRITVR